MPYCRLEDSAADHPKIRKLAKRLRISEAQALGHMCCLWSWCVRMAPDGRLDNFDNEDIALAAKTKRNPDEFVATLVGLHLLDNHTTHLEVHGYYHRSDTYLKTKKKRLERDGNKNKDLQGDVARQGGDREAMSLREEREREIYINSAHADTPVTAPEKQPQPKKRRAKKPTPPPPSTASVELLGEVGGSRFLRDDPATRTKRLKMGKGGPDTWSVAYEESLLRVWEAYARAYPQPNLGGRPLPEYDASEGLQLRVRYLEGVRSRGSGESALATWEQMLVASMPGSVSSKRLEFIDAATRTLVTMLKDSVWPSWVGVSGTKSVAPERRRIPYAEYYAQEEVQDV